MRRDYNRVIHRYQRGQSITSISEELGLGVNEVARIVRGVVIKAKPATSVVKRTREDRRALNRIIHRMRLYDESPAQAGKALGYKGKYVTELMKEVIDL